METFHRTTRFPVPREALFAWHERPGALERLTPPWERVQIVEQASGLKAGSRLALDVSLGFIKQRWIVEHGDYERGFLFSDTLVKGPFPHWHHKHIFRDAEGGSSELEDRIEYAHPNFLSEIFLSKWISTRMERAFCYRHEILLQDGARYGEGAAKPLNIVVSGGTGLIGRTLVPLLQTQGNHVRVLSRSAGEGHILWDPERGDIDKKSLEGTDAVVHLAGEGIMGRWTNAKKARIYKSRVEGTRLLAKTLADLDAKPSVLVSVSGVSANRSSGFLSEVGRAWEAAANPAREAGIRVVHPRVSVVLSPAGGALKSMLPVFKLGLGGPIGSGKQRMSWIAIDDLADVLYAAIIGEHFEGPFTVSAPEVLSNRAFTKALACRLNRPARLPVPPKVLRAMLGEVACETVLADVNEPPDFLTKLGHTFRYPSLAQALDHLLP